VALGGELFMDSLRRCVLQDYSYLWAGGYKEEVVIPLVTFSVPFVPIKW